MRLRWLTSDDCAHLFRIFSHPEVMRYWSSPPYTGVEQAAALVESIQRCFRERSLFQWGIEEVASKAIVGTCTLASLDRQNRRAEIGFALAHSHWGKGYACRGISAAIQYAFGPLGLMRMEADVDPRNAASLRTLERLGFQREGYFRQRWHVNGEVCDSVMLGLLAEEWSPPAFDSPR